MRPACSMIGSPSYTSSPPGPTTLVTPLGKGVIRESSAPPGAVAAGSATPNQGSRP